MVRKEPPEEKCGIERKTLDDVRTEGGKDKEVVDRGRYTGEGTMGSGESEHAVEIFSHVEDKSEVNAVQERSLQWKRKRDDGHGEFITGLHS